MTADNRPTNRLAQEASPYLRQHMHNPVDWYPWGDEAFERAVREDKPILLSVGYAACHWCHVMEETAFDVEEVAAEMNRDFVCVKVDREERPDVDSLYQGVVQLMGRGGGWPLTVFLTPQGRPFFGGTYFPPEDRWGLPGFSRLLGALADTWKNRRDEVEKSAHSFDQGLSQLALAGVGTGREPIGAADVARAAERLGEAIDPVHGGFGEAPKFPHPMELAFLLRASHRGVKGAEVRGREEIEEGLRRSLERMRAGGIYDQLGGGFHRYAVDERWAVPHFEKMLYDNALLLRLYAEASVALDEPRWAATAREIAAWMAREMTDAGGGLFSSQDADSEGEEGKFFVWTPEQLEEVLGQDLAPLAAERFGVEAGGNFEGGTTVLHLAASLAALARRHGLGEAEIEVRLGEGRKKLLEARSRRIAPATDDKVLAGWNGLAIGALAASARLLSEPALLEQARRAAVFVLDHLVVEGELHRVWRLGQVKQPAFLDDYAWLAEGLLELFESTGESRWLEEAQRLAASALDRFWDEEKGIFWLDPAEGEELLHRVPAVHDNATPAGGSSLTHVLLRLHALTGDDRAGAVADRYLAGQREEMVRNPFAFGHLLCAAWLQVQGIVEVAVLGPRGPSRDELLGVARDGYRPEILAFAAEEGIGVAFEGRGAMDGAPAAYVCRGFACERGRTDPGELARALEVR